MTEYANEIRMIGDMTITPNQELIDAVLQGLGDSYDAAVTSIRHAVPFFAAEGLDGTYYRHDDGTWERVPDGEFRGPEGAFCVAPAVLR